MGFGGLGMWEIILIFLVVLLLFGAKRLPEIGASLGKGIREFKGSVREIEREINTPERNESLQKGEESSGSARGGESGSSEARSEDRDEEPEAEGTSRLTTDG